MATATKGTSAIVDKAHQQETAVEVAGPNRREFLYYIWGASLLMFLGQSGAFFVWYALPRFKEGEFGGTFVFPGADLPSLGSAPLEVPEGRIWLSNSADGFLALYAVCTHLGCLPGWSATEFRFECPCHGSRFELNGDYLAGPAPRGLDRYSTTIIFTDGTSATASDGSPIQLQGREIAEVRVDTGSRTNGPAIGS